MATEKSMSTEEFYKKLSKDDKKAVRNLNERRKIDFIPTGSWVINTLIGDGTGTYQPGGLPRGHIVEVFGDESCGKTTLGISACKQVQDMGGIPIWLDFERTFSPDYAERLGLNCDPHKFIFFEPENFEHGARLIRDCFKMRPHLIVVDSVSAMIPRSFLEGKIDDSQRIGLQAQLMSMSLNFLTKDLPVSNTCLLFINQLRSMIKGKYDTGPDEETSGGRALKYYASVRLKMKKSTIEKIEVTSRITGKKDKEPINVMVKVAVVKNKIDKPYFTGPVYIRFGDGFDNISSIIELATNINVIKKSGAFYKFSVNGELIFSCQGKQQLRTLLEEDEAKLKLLTSHITLKEDKETKLEGSEDPENESESEDDLDALLNNASTNFEKKVKDSDD